MVARKHSLALLLAFSGLLLTSCDPIYRIKSNIAYNTKMSDLSCVAKAIQTLPDVKLLAQHKTTPIPNCEKVGCIRAEYLTEYQILGTKNKTVAELKIVEYVGKKPDIWNQATSPFHDFPSEDKSQIEAVVKAVGQRVSNQCQSE